MDNHLKFTKIENRINQKFKEGDYQIDAIGWFTFDNLDWLISYVYKLENQITELRYQQIRNMINKLEDQK